MIKQLTAIALLAISGTANALDLDYVTDVTYAQDGKESSTEVITGIEIYSKPNGLSLMVGIGYTKQEAEFYGSIQSKSNQGLYLNFTHRAKIK